MRIKLAIFISFNQVTCLSYLILLLLLFVIIFNYNFFFPIGGPLAVRRPQAPACIAYASGRPCTRTHQKRHTRQGKEYSHTTQQQIQSFIFLFTCFCLMFFIHRISQIFCTILYFIIKYVQCMFL